VRSGARLTAVEFGIPAAHGTRQGGQAGEPALRLGGQAGEPENGNKPAACRGMERRAGGGTGGPRT